MGFELPELKYAYDALEPHIDALTMEIHHTKHHAAYTGNLNAAIDGTDMDGKSIEELLIENGGGEPTGELSSAINDAFGSFDSMKEEFAKAAMTRFGSGWAWLCVSDGSLCILSTPNQDNPIMQGEGIPIMGIDVWEHAYYKKYGPGRADYINSWWNVVDWSIVLENYQNAL